MVKEVKFDDSGWKSGLDKLAGPIKESIARRMAVAGGKVLRDAAQTNARVSHAKSTWVYNEKGSSNSSDEAGTLADAIYLSRDKSRTTQTNYAYRISWNNTLAWWGRLREFGYYMRYSFYKSEDGKYHSSKKYPLKDPIRIPPDPFLAPAYDQNIESVRTVMLETGKKAVGDLTPGGRS